MARSDLTITNEQSKVGNFYTNQQLHLILTFSFTNANNNG
jgi:hypothetical protein